MDKQQKLVETIKNLPTWAQAAIGLATAVISFVILFQDNYYLGVTVLGILMMTSGLCLCLYLAYAKTPPLIAGGTGVYRFEKYRPWAFAGISFIILISSASFAFKPSRAFMTTAVMRTAAELGIVDLTKGRNIELVYKNINSRYYNKLDFIVSNTSYDVFLVDSIWLEIIDMAPYEITGFPEGPAMPPSHSYAYTVTISPSHSLYLVTDDNFIYSPGEVEEFSVKVESLKPGYIYEIMTRIDWYSLDQPKTRKQSVFGPHLMDFPIGLSLKTILEEAKRVDYFLNDMGATDNFFYEYPLDTHTARFLVSRQIQGRVQVPLDVDIRYFDKAEVINLSHYGVGTQYLIIDSEIVIQHIYYFEAEVIREPEEVQQYTQHFNQLWQASREN